MREVSPLAVMSWSRLPLAGRCSRELLLHVKKYSATCGRGVHVLKSALGMAFRLAGVSSVTLYIIYNYSQSVEQKLATSKLTAVFPIQWYQLGDHCSADSD